jgi:Rad3-related DNA helicase
MQVDFLSTGDGTNRKPRDEQVDYMSHLSKVWNDSKILGLLAPPGVGKSYIARTIQRTVPNTQIITINNNLVDQYVNTYPELNPLKGLDYYETLVDYKLSRARAAVGPNVCNPLSFYYYYLRNPDYKPTTVVIDEAHRIDEMLLMTLSQSFPCATYGIPKDLTYKEFHEWLIKVTNKLGLVTKTETETQKRLNRIYEKFKIIADYLQGRLDTVKIFYEMKEEGFTPPGKKKQPPKLHLTIQPVRMPVGLLETIFGKDTRILLMSGTLTRAHLERWYPNESKIDFVQYAPVAPVENRLVHYCPVSGDSRWTPDDIANAIRSAFLSRERPTTLVHVSYAFGKVLAPLLSDLRPIVNTKEDKQAKIEEFKAKGGLFLASGMAEGVDLPGNLCRLLIIPRIIFPNLADQGVQKLLAMPDGQMWYSLNALLQVVQQLGRGVRGADDSCESIIMDPKWPRLIHDHGHHMTEGFLAGNVWHSPGIKVKSSS